ncbi:uncharacterized protein VTP21DRAFT_8104 [Calcarisporiella thermophila]|uniref:uncharacterized protein n=1 Tax=Calcarisporiella thermophila TaxID=911321 RepID=UPI003743FDCF
MVFVSHTISDARLEHGEEENSEVYSSTVYGTRWAIAEVPRYEMPEDEMPPRVAYKFIKDELALDGTPALNLASFVTTYMEEEAEKLIAENNNKNFIDFEQYPISVELQNRCVNMLGRLFHAPMNDPQSEALGVSTVGSSEAIMLAVLAMKRRWQHRMREQGKPTDKPNIVMGANVQVCWEKAANYLEIEMKFVYLTETTYIATPEKVVELIDENTIGVCSILGSTMTGLLHVPIHVDAASGGMVVPFIKPGLEWDFRLPLVSSINVSGHKYGLCLPGIGWVLFRDKTYLPEDLIFKVNYLGTDQASFTLNFTKSASPIIAQYYILIRLGRKGFTSIMRNLMMNAEYFTHCLKRTGRFRILSNLNNGLPVVVFSLAGEQKYDEFDVASRVRERGWIIPAYTLPPKAEKIKVLRVVIREDFARHRADLLVKDIMAALRLLDKLDIKAIYAKRDASRRWAMLKNATLAFRKKFKNDSEAGEEEAPYIVRDSGVC